MTEHAEHLLQNVFNVFHSARALRGAKHLSSFLTTSWPIVLSGVHRLQKKGNYLRYIKTWKL